MSRRVWTIEYHHAFLTLRNMFTPERAVVVGGAKSPVDLGRLKDETAPLGEIYDLFQQRWVEFQGFRTSLKVTGATPRS